MSLIMPLKCVPASGESGRLSAAPQILVVLNLHNPFLIKPASHFDITKLNKIQCISKERHFFCGIVTSKHLKTRFYS